jgi:predicted acyl esterase
MALVFNRGHRIAVHVTSSSYERFERDPNAGALYRADKQVRRAQNTVEGAMPLLVVDYAS